jgi:hypothetical protein
MPHRFLTAGYVAVIAAAGFAVNHASQARSEQKLRLLVNTCERVANPSRALARIAASPGTERLYVHFEPIVNCRETYFSNSGIPVPARPQVQASYVSLIKRGVLPIVAPDGSLANEAIPP